MLAVADGRPVEDLALAAVEARHVAARQRHPHHVVGVDVHAARAVSRRREFVDFRKRRRGRLALGRIEPHDVAGEAERGAPHRAVDRARRHPVERDVDPAVLVGIERLVRLGPLVTLAVGVGVEDEGSPALRLHFVAGLFQHLHIDPAGHAACGAARTRPCGIIRVKAELHVVGGEAGVDEREFLSLRVVHFELTPGSREREHLRRGMV